MITESTKNTDSSTAAPNDVWGIIFEYLVHTDLVTFGRCACANKNFQKLVTDLLNKKNTCTFILNRFVEASPSIDDKQNTLTFNADTSPLGPNYSNTKALTFYYHLVIKCLPNIQFLSRLGNKHIFLAPTILHVMKRENAPLYLAAPAITSFLSYDFFIGNIVDCYLICIIDKKKIPQNAPFLGSMVITLLQCLSVDLDRQHKEASLNLHKTASCFLSTILEKSLFDVSSPSYDRYRDDIKLICNKAIDEIISNNPCFSSSNMLFFRMEQGKMFAFRQSVTASATLFKTLLKIAPDIQSTWRYVESGLSFDHSPNTLNFLQMLINEDLLENAPTDSILKKLIACLSSEIIKHQHSDLISPCILGLLEKGKITAASPHLQDLVTELINNLPNSFIADSVNKSKRCILEIIELNLITINSPNLNMWIEKLNSYDLIPSAGSLDVRCALSAQGLIK